MPLNYFDPEQIRQECRARAIAAYESNHVPPPDAFLSQAPAAREQRLRRLALKSGYFIKKPRGNQEDVRTWGHYNILDAFGNNQWCGDDLEAAEEWLKKNRLF